MRERDEEKQSIGEEKESTYMKKNNHREGKTIWLLLNRNNQRGERKNLVNDEKG